MSLAKVELNEIGTLANSASARQAINDNFQKIEDEFKKVVYRDGSTPNSMEADLDMDSHRILNVADAVHDKDAVNKGQVADIAYEAAEVVWQPRFDALVSHVDDELSRALKLDGAGTYNANGKRLRGLPYASATDDAATLGQVMDQIQTAISNPNTELFLQNGPGSVPRTIADKGREWVSPLDKGAVGDGLADDTAALVASGPNLTLPPGRTFRVSTNASIGNILAAGGQITVDSGVTLTVNGVFGDPAAVIFNGAGTVRMASDHYSVGWYAGASINEKWDFLRRALVTNVPYTCIFPRPSENDPAASNSANGTTVWKLTAPLKFNDPENRGHIYMLAPIYAAAPVGQMLLFSDTEKTEDILFPFGLELDGGNNAANGIEIRGGARIQFSGNTSVVRCTNNGVHLQTTAFPTDEVTFDFINVTDNGNIGFLNEGTAGNLSLGTRINYLFCNGVKATGKSALSVRGLVRNFTCENVMENLHFPAGLFDFTECTVRFEATAAGSPRYKSNRIGTIHNHISAKPSFIASDASGGTASKIGVSIGTIRNNNAVGAVAKLAWTDSATLHDVDGGSAQLVEVNTTCSDINLPNLRPEQVSGRCDRLRVSGGYVGYDPSLADDTAFSIAFPPESLGYVEVTSSDMNAWAIFACKDGTSLAAVAKGPAANLATGALTGTSGTDGMLNISASGNRIYVENRLGSSQRVKIAIRL